MKILQMHSDFIEYKPVRKEIELAENTGKERVRYENVIVLFVAVENGDDEPLIEQALNDLTSFSQKVNEKKIVIYPFAHLSTDLARPETALEILRKMEKKAAEKGFEVTRAPFGWNKEFQIKVKGHPLAETLRTYSHEKKDVKKISHTGKEKHEELLSRMKKVEYSGLPETDHRIIGERLDLFSFYEQSPGMPYWHDKGLILRNILIETIRKELRKRGYIEISTALLANVDLWKVSGHYEHYKENMFLTSLNEEGELFGLKPMNCPSTILYYMSRRWSYKDLPLRISDFDMLFRKELSGVVSGLFRVKSFVQDDAHIFCTEEQVEQELTQLIELVDYFYSLFKLPYKAKVSTMPDEHLGSEEQWRAATEALISSLRKKGVEPQIKEKEGAFYGPKIDFEVTDSLGREWQLATIQLDYQLPERFNLSYTGKDGKEHRPVIIHRVIYGSLERFIGIILEHYKGKLPLWLSPVQVRVIPISDEVNGYAKEVFEFLSSHDIRAELDLQQGTLNSKVRQAQLMKVPLMVILGREEMQNKLISVRTREGEVIRGIRLEELVNQIKSKVSSFM